VVLSFVVKDLSGIIRKNARERTCVPPEIAAKAILENPAEEPKRRSDRLIAKGVQRVGWLQCLYFLRTVL
jgi:hypothetical protein